MAKKLFIHAGPHKPRSLKHLQPKTRIFLKKLFSEETMGDPDKAVAISHGAKNAVQAHNKAMRLLKNPAVQNEFQILMQKAGLGDEAIMAYVKKALGASMPISYKGRVTKKWPDWNARHRFLQTMLELADKFPEKRSKIKAEINDISEGRKQEIKQTLIGILGADGNVKGGGVSRVING